MRDIDIRTARSRRESLLDLECLWLLIIARGMEVVCSGAWLLDERE